MTIVKCPKCNSALQINIAKALDETEKFLNVLTVILFLDMPTDEDLEKIFRLKKAYTQLGVYAQQRINLFDYIREHWNG